MSETSAATAPPAPPRRRIGRVLGLAALAVAVLTVATLGAAWFTWRSDAGLAWLIERVPGLQITGRQGRPDGGAFSAERLQWEGGGTRVVVQGLSWQDLQWRWRPHAGTWLGVTLTGPHVQRVEVKTTPTDEPAKPRSGAPNDLRLPIELAVSDLRVDQLQVDEAPLVTALGADLHLGDEAGTLHRVQRFTAQAAQRELRATLSAAATGSMKLEGRIDLTSLPAAAQPLQAQLTLGGTVPRPTLAAALSAGDKARLDAQATLAPFEAWPLLALELSTENLDLAALANGLPGTRLSGRAVVDSRGADQPVSVQVDLVNALPGAWNELRLPVQALRATVQGQPSQRQRLDLSALDLRLQGTRAAGRVSGTGRWENRSLSLDLALDGLQAAQLHTAMANLDLSGPLRLRLSGVPSPAPDATPGPSPLTADVQADLRGNLRPRGSPARPVQLKLAGDMAQQPNGSLRAQASKLELAAGQARATATAQVQRDAQQLWQIRSEGSLQRFDPSNWWAGPDTARWRRGPHALNGNWKTAISAPATAFASTWRPMLLALRGDARVQLQDSQLSGVPLRADLNYKAEANSSQLDASLQAASSRATAQFTVATQPSADKGEFDIDAPALAALAPLFDAVPGADAWFPTSGSLRGKASARGGWPDLRTEGQLQAEQVQSKTWRVGRASAQWGVATRDVGAPLSVQLEATNLQQGEQRLDTLSATVDGTLRQHRLQVRAASPLRPPAWTDAATIPTKAPPQGGTLALDGNGAWSNEAAGGGVWKARFDTLRAAPPQEGATPWVDARGLDATLRFNVSGALSQASLAPGAMQLLGAGLRWSQAAYEAAASPQGAPRLQLDAQLDALSISPWLARLQPQFGWGGDLRLGGRFQIRSAERFDADVVVERLGGDLTITDTAGTRSLGLRDLRVAAAAHDGNWRLTQTVSGSQLGELAGSQTVKAPANATYPPPESPLQGTLNLKMNDLAAWSAWLPVGWRVGGELRADATLGGRVGAPEYSGRVDGSKLAASNLLQGVNLTDGRLAVALQGTRARIEQLVFKGGDGEVRGSGEASFGESPQAQLKLIAQRFLAIGRIDRRVVMSGEANLALQAKRVALNGRFDIDEGNIDVSQSDGPTLDDDVTVINETLPGRPASAKSPAPDPAAGGGLQNADVNIAIDLGERLRLHGRGLDTQLRGALRVTTPSGKLALNGTVRTESGTYKAYGQNLAIERGVFVFSGDLAAPRIDILAVRPDIDVRVGVAVQGNAADPRIRLYSEPEMNEMDKLSWLVTGRASEGLGQADTALLQRAALALLAGDKDNSSGGFAQRLGLDELSVSRGDSGEVRDTMVTLGKQLSKRVFVAYERGLSATAGSWQLIYRVAQRITLRAQSGDDSAVDVIWTWRWN